MLGMPDVEGCLRGSGQFWLELKTADRPVRGDTLVRFKTRDREAQVAWLRRRWEMGGNSWLLLQVGSGMSGRRLYLIPGLCAAQVYEGLAEGRLRELSTLSETSPTPLDVVKRAALLREHLEHCPID